MYIFTKSVQVHFWGKAKVDSSVFTVSEGGIVQEGGKIVSDLWGPTCKMSRLGSND